MNHWGSFKLCVVTVAFCGLFALVFRESTSVAAQTPTPTGTTTTRIIKIPAPPGARGFGYAIAYDGKTLVVGAPQTPVAGRQQAGALYVYDLDPAKPDAWQLTATLTDGLTTDFTLLGEAVAVEDDVIVGGAPRARMLGVSQLGFVAFFERTSATPLWHRTYITYDQRSGAFANLGHSIAIDQGIVRVGAPGADAYDISGHIIGQNFGTVYSYSRRQQQPGAWITATILPIHNEAGRFNDLFGSAVAYSNQHLLVGEQSGDLDTLFGNEGRAYYYTALNIPPTELRGQREPARDADQFGHAVALDNDGATPLVAIGGYNIQRNGQSGVGGVWITQAGVGTHMVYANDGQAYDYFGYAVAAHKAVVVVGAPDADQNFLIDQGALYRFEPTGPTADQKWQATAKYTIATAEEGGYLGRSVAVYDGLVLAGANGADNGQGAVYLFVEAAAPPTAKLFLPAVTKEARSTGLLTNDNAVVDASGARLGAVAGTLAQPINVYIQQSAPPTVPLTQAVTLVGNHFILGADELVYAPVDKPFLVGLPVPEGVDTRQLAVAILENPDGAEKAGLDEAGWVSLPGAFDPTTRLFSFTLPRLLPTGLSVVLIVHETHTLLPLDPATAALPTVQSAAPTDNVDFTVKCAEYSLPLLTPAACSAINIGALKSALLTAYNDFSSKGFRDPALNRHIAKFFPGSGKPALTLYESFYPVYIQPAPCNGAVGRFRPGTQSLFICIDGAAGVNDEVMRTVRHELFHAIQFAYPGLRADFHRGIINWVAEGTAAAAETSISGLHRSPDFSVRTIDPALPDYRSPDNIAYQTQDFWVYLGQEQGTQLNYLIPIFEAGADLTEVNGAMGGNLGGAYWSWVKNQFYEKSNTLEGALTGGACAPELDLVNETRTGFGLADGNNKQWSGSLDRLAAHVYQIGIDDTLDNPSVWVEGGATIRYKIYREGKGSCETLPENETVTFDQLTSSDFLQVIVANTGIIGAPAPYVVRINAGGE